MASDGRSDYIDEQYLDLDGLAKRCGVDPEQVLAKLQRAIDNGVPQWYHFNAKECKFLSECVKFHL